MADVLDRVELDHLAADKPSYVVRPLGAGWVLEIEDIPGVWLEQFVETEVDAHVRAAQLALLMRHG